MAARDTQRQSPPTEKPPEQTQPSPGLVALGATGVAVGPATPPAKTAKIAAKATAETTEVLVHAAVIAAILRGLDRMFARKARSDARYLTDMLRGRFPTEPDDVIRVAVTEELDREGKFQAKQRKRMERDLNAIAGAPDYEQQANVILEREKRYLKMRESAMIARSVAAVERSLLKQLSPWGAFWKLSPHVKEHTLDCLYMGNRWWPWDVLDVIHPPLHPGCPCMLYGRDEAIRERLITPDEPLPEPQDALYRAQQAVARAQRLQEALGVDEARALVEASWREELHPRSRLGRFIAKLLPDTSEPGRSRGVWIKGAFHRVREGPAFERHVGGVRFHSPPGSLNLYRADELVSGPAVAPRHRDVKPLLPFDPRQLRRMGSADSRIETALEDLDSQSPPVVRGQRGAWFSGLEGHGLVLIGFRREEDVDHYNFRHFQTGSQLAVRADGQTIVDFDWHPRAHRGYRPYLDHTPDTMEEWFDDMRGWADRVSQVEDLGVTDLVDVSVHQPTADHSAYHNWAGKIGLGRAFPSTVDTDAAMRAGDAGAVAFDPDGHLGQVYTIYQVSAHEIAHTINTVQGGQYTGSARMLEEALTEEVSHILTVRRLREQGRTDVLEWAKTHPTNNRTTGTYQVARRALEGVLNDARVPAEDREKLIFDLKFRIPTEQRIDTLARLLHAARDSRDPSEGDLASVGTEVINRMDATMDLPLNVPTGFTPILAADLADIDAKPERSALTWLPFGADSPLTARVGDIVTFEPTLRREAGVPDTATGVIEEIDPAGADDAGVFTVRLTKPYETEPMETFLDVVGNWDVESVVSRGSDAPEINGMHEGDPVTYTELDGSVRSGVLERIVLGGERWDVQVRLPNGTLANLTPERVRSFAPDMPVAAELHPGVAASEAERTVEWFRSIFADFEHGGLTATISRQRTWPPAGGQIRFDIKDEDGISVGYGDYSVQGQGAHIDRLFLNERVQDRGFATALHVRLFDELRARGVRWVDLEAAQVGSYAWARAGFVFLRDPVREGRRLFASHEPRMGGELPPLASMADHGVPKDVITEFKRKLAQGEFASEAEIAAWGREHTWTDGEGRTMWPGKFALIGWHWYGQREL